MDGQERHFSAGGLYDGMSVIVDDETRTYWNHMSGEGLYGPDAGKVLDGFPIEIMTVREARDTHPDLTVSRSDPGWMGWVAGLIMGRPHEGRGGLPPGFRETMGKPDDRLPELTSGIGVVVAGHAKFYPFGSLRSPVTDTLGGRRIVVSYPAGRSTPAVRFEDGTAPFHLLTRWYGFAYSYPGCAVHPLPAEAAR